MKEKCPVCDEGVLDEKFEIAEGHQPALVYAQCTVCECEICNAGHLTLNKQYLKEYLDRQPK